MIGKLLRPEISEIIRDRNFSALRDLLGDWAPADIAELITDLPEGDRAVVFRILPKNSAAETFEYLDIET